MKQFMINFISHARFCALVIMYRCMYSSTSRFHVNSCRTYLLYQTRIWAFFLFYSVRSVSSSIYHFKKINFLCLLNICPVPFTFLIMSEATKKICCVCTKGKAVAFQEETMDKVSLSVIFLFRYFDCSLSCFYPVVAFHVLYIFYIIKYLIIGYFLTYRNRRRLLMLLYHYHF